MRYVVALRSNDGLCRSFARHGDGGFHYNSGPPIPLKSAMNLAFKTKVNLNAQNILAQVAVFPASQPLTVLEADAAPVVAARNLARASADSSYRTGTGECSSPDD